MAAHHQTSPPSAMMAHHRLPGGVQPNGAQPPYATGGQRLAGPHEHLQHLNETTWIAIGKCAEAMGNSETAVFSYRRATHFNHDSLEGLHLLASVLRSQDKFSEAVDFLQRILHIDPRNGEAWSNLGHCFLMMDELQQAYAAYQSALYNLPDPKEPKLWYGIGILYDRYGSLDHAEEAFSQVMRMAPHFDKANEIYFRLGIIYKQQGKFESSLECFRYISENPPSPLSKTDIWFQIGHVYEQQKDYAAAKNAYRKVLEHDEHHAKVLQQLGWLHHQESSDFQSQEQAIEYLEKSVNSDQTDAQSWYLLGRCYMSQQKYPKAYEAYQQAVYRDGRNPTFWCSIGVLYYQINQYRDALDAYSRAIRLNPNISEVWYDLGTLYESCNNQTSDALDAYQRAAELDPNNQHIKARLQLLRNGQPTGLPNQSVAPLPQDVHPQAYQPPGVNGPPQPQWGSMPQGQAPPGQAPPPPLSTREWGPRPGEGPGAPPPGQPPHVPPYDARDPGRGYPPATQPSPRVDHLRHEAGHRPTSSVHRAPSPSPRAREAIPSAYRGPQSVPPGSIGHAPPPPASQAAPPPNRISNPNYGQPLPPAPSHMGASTSGGPQPPYSRVSPPPEIRPLNDTRPRSPRSGSYGQHPPSTQAPGSGPYGYRSDPNAQPNIATGAPAPMQALEAAEAAARERDGRDDGRSSVPKRIREWEEDSHNKKPSTDDSRAKLDDPNFTRPGATPPRPGSVYENGRMPIGGPASGSAGPSSPDAARRAEEQKRADDNYRPSEAAHHPQPLNLSQHQDAAPTQLPPINVPHKEEPVSPRQEEVKKPEVEAPAAPAAAAVAATESKDGDGDVAMRQPEEPAARKIEVNENYDDDSGEDEGKAAAKPAESAKDAPKAANAHTDAGANGQSNGMTNGAPAEAKPVEA